MNAVDDHHNTALHLAAKSGLTEVVGRLIAHGAVVGLENEGKSTAADLAGTAIAMVQM